MKKIALWTLVLQTGLLMSMERPNSSFPPLPIALAVVTAALQNPFDQAASTSDKKKLLNTQQIISYVQVPQHEQRPTSKSLPNGHKGKQKHR